MFTNQIPSCAKSVNLNLLHDEKATLQQRVTCLAAICHEEHHGTLSLGDACSGVRQNPVNRLAVFTWITYLISELMTFRSWPMRSRSSQLAHNCKLEREVTLDMVMAVEHPTRPFVIHQRKNGCTSGGIPAAKTLSRRQLARKRSKFSISSVLLCYEVFICQIEMSGNKSAAFPWRPGTIQCLPIGLNMFNYWVHPIMWSSICMTGFSTQKCLSISVVLLLNYLPEIVEETSSIYSFKQI